MKKYMLFTLAFTLLCCGVSLPATAQDVMENTTEATGTATKKKATKKKRKQVSPVHQALSKVSSINGKINKKAEFYFFLQSASWCGFCRKEMPDIVKAYRKMKKEGVEILLFSHDKTEDAAKGFIKEFNMKFPVTMNLGDNVPGFQRSGGIPSLIIVDEYGNAVGGGHPKMLMPQWENIIKEAKKQKKEIERAAEEAASENE